MQLVIVESPAKATTINKYLGSGYRVMASFGHVRDLSPKDGSVRPDDDFAMRWESMPDSAKQLRAISDAAKRSDRLILATDPDREGEAIAWHVVEELTAKRALRDKPVERVSFNAITETAVREAIRKPREIDRELVDAYLARRALDYLVGFSLSPVLWRKLPGSRSAGRVQSVALRLIVERERAIEAFVSREYWSIAATLRTEKGEQFPARLHALDGKTLGKFALGDEAAANAALARVRAGRYRVTDVETKSVSRNPPPPFTTSTLQQEAARKLGLDAKAAMRAAQRLYEEGRITYMRTDGVQMAPEAYSAARSEIGREFGNDYLPDRARRYSTKAKNAQEAHEAIRPTRFDARSRGSEVEEKLHDLIWKRAVASQMQAALFDRTRADLSDEDDGVLLRATGQTIRFDGFTRLYNEGRDDAEDETFAALPRLMRTQPTELAAAAAKSHRTEPPPRYSESSLVKKMEELGIGRPSTYASTLSTLRDRSYVRMERKRFVPEDTGRLVTQFLEEFFEALMAYDFTAELEAQLDLVSDGKLAWKKLLSGFWHGFHAQIDKVSALTRSEIIDSLDEAFAPYLFRKPDDGGDPRACPGCADGRLGMKLSRHGAFVGCSNYPDCQYTRPFGASGSVPEPADGEGSLGTHPDTGETVSVKTGRYGPYVEAGGADKPRRASIPKEWSPESLTLEKACALLTLPREIGSHPEDGKPVKAGVGPYGPYVAHERTYARLESVDEALSVGLNRAVALIADKRANPSGRKQASVLRDLGPHPDSGEPLRILDGRFGPYVKCGRVNATLPDGVKPEDLDLGQALELVAAKAAGKAGKKKRRPPGPRRGS